MVNMEYCNGTMINGYQWHRAMGEPEEYYAHAQILDAMRHDSSLACTEQEAPCHLPVRQGVGEETQKSERGESTGEFGEGLPVLRVTAVNSHLFQVYGKGSDGGGRQLDRCGGKPEKGSE